MHQQLWGYKVEKKIYVGVREQKRLNTTALNDSEKWILAFVTKITNICMFSIVTFDTMLPWSIKLPLTFWSSCLCRFTVIMLMSVYKVTNVPVGTIATMVTMVTNVHCLLWLSKCAINVSHCGHLLSCLQFLIHLTVFM